MKVYYSQGSVRRGNSSCSDSINEIKDSMKTNYNNFLLKIKVKLHKSFAKKLNMTVKLQESFAKK